MTSRTYRNKQENIYKEKISLLIKGLPLFAESFFNGFLVSGKAPSTVCEYAKDIKKLFDYLEERKNIDDIRDLPVSYLEEITIDDLTDFLLSSNIGEKARARRTASIRKFFMYYVKRSDIKENPALLLDTVKIHEKEIITMNGNEVVNILDMVTKMTGKDENGNIIKKREKTITRDYALLVTLLGTGMRVSEMLGLDLTDIDMKNKCFHIVRKGNKEDRVYFGEEVEKALKMYLENGRDKIGAGKEEPNALFISLQHKRITTRSVDRIVKEFSRAAGLGEHITPHKFRSTYGTNLYNATGDIYLVADALGHSSVETTRKRYAKISEPHKRLAADISSNLFLDDQDHGE